MIYIILTIVFSFLGILTFLPQFQNIIERYSIGINFFMTIIATLVGVLIAITITNHDANQKEKQDLIKLINSAITSVEVCYEFSEQMLKHKDKLPNQSTTNTEFDLNHLPPYPDYLDTFLMQNIVSENLSGATLSALNTYIINLKRSRAIHAPLYLNVLGQTLKVLDLEVDYQAGQINDAQLQSELSALKNI